MLGELQSLLVVFGTLESIPTVQVAVLWCTSGVLTELYIPKPYISTPLQLLFRCTPRHPALLGLNREPQNSDLSTLWSLNPKEVRNPHSSTQNPETYLEGQGGSVSRLMTSIIQKKQRPLSQSLTYLLSPHDPPSNIASQESRKLFGPRSFLRSVLRTWPRLARSLGI